MTRPTVRARLVRARLWLAVAVVLAALLWAIAVGLGLTLVTASLQLASAAGIVAAALVLWRWRAARSLTRVALWIEEQDPSLHYTLVTAIDVNVERHQDLHIAAGHAAIEHAVRQPAIRLLAGAAGACLLSVTALGILRPHDLLRATASRTVAGKREVPNKLVTLTARVAPPAYSRLPALTVPEPSNVAALIGSTVALMGKGAADGVTANMGTGARSDHGGWTIELRMPKDPVVVELHDRAYRRLVALQPIVDSAPNVTLKLPAHDTTYQTVPKGKLVIEAQLTDDIGLASGYVEYMLSTGAEESFETKQFTGHKVPYDHARDGDLREAIDLDTLSLKPGSVLHIRAVALDYNDVTGPGKGVSETRTLRVAEPVDSTSINAAPPLPIDSMWISQRLLNFKTDTLIQHRRTLGRQEFVHTSTGYSNAQESIRQRALTVIALLEDNGVGDSFETETSKLLRTAVDLMWTAREDLGVAHPDSALPSMKKILAILDQLRLAHRYYLRGLLRPVAVNVERVRMTGKDSAAAGARTRRAMLADANSALAARIDAAAGLAHRAAPVAADSLTFIRVAALSAAPSIAGALQVAIDRLRRGLPADSALTRVRRLLEARPRVASGGGEWGGVIP